MIEALPRQELLFPEFNGDLANWQRDVDILRAALESPRGFDYEAHLPEIIGWVPDAEQKKISSWSRTYDCSWSPGYPNPLEANARMCKNSIPQTLELIMADIEIASGGLAKFNQFEVEKKYTPRGERPRPGLNLGTGLHVDQIVRFTNDSVKPIYIICDTDPTRFYQGPARLWSPDAELMLDLAALDTDPARVVSAPAFAIIRLSGATVHASPTFEKGGVRTFIRIGSTLKIPQRFPLEPLNYDDLL